MKHRIPFFLFFLLFLKIINVSAQQGLKSPGGDILRPLLYVDILTKCEPQFLSQTKLNFFYDYDEAIIASKKTKKPILLYFSGLYCMPCRKMEEKVWDDPHVIKLLNDNFIVAILYCDANKYSCKDIHDLPAKQQHYSEALGKKIVTLGDRNAELEMYRYKQDSQPIVYIVDEKLNTLTSRGSYSYDLSVDNFITYLSEGKNNYNKIHP